MIRSREWLIKKRKEKGLTQKELAVKLGISAYTIENIEQGKRLGSINTWSKIEDYFLEEKEADIKTSYDSSELIEELKADIAEFGSTHECILVYKVIDNRIIFTNYDFITDEMPFNPKKDLKKDEKYIETSLMYALEVFEAQNKII